MMVGIGIFATFGAATEAAGSGILVAILLGGSVALATGISAAQLGVNNATEGGAFTWARDFDHDTLGFIAGCGYLGKNLVSMSVIALAFATYLGQVIPGLPEHLVAAAGVPVIMGLNLFGIQLTSRVLIGLLTIDVLLLALYGGASLHSVDARHFAPVLGDKGTGLFAGAAIFFWTWDGFMRMAIMASEVKQPRRTIPIAVIGGIAIATVTYIGVGAITLGVLGADAIGQQDTPLLATAQKVIGQWGVAIVLAAATASRFVIRRALARSHSTCAAAARGPPGRVAQIATSPRSCSSLRSKSARFASTRVVGAPVARSSRTPAVTRRTITSARAASPATTVGVSPSCSQITAGKTAYDRRFARGSTRLGRG